MSPPPGDEESGSGTGTGSSSYPFYVELDSEDGLMLGQHVYVEVDRGQGEEQEKTGIWLSESYVVENDGEDPYVFADNGSGHLKKQTVTLGERDENRRQVQIASGLTEKDKIALPAAGVIEGLPTTENAAEAADFTDFDGLAEEGLTDGGAFTEEGLTDGENTTEEGLTEEGPDR